MARITYVMPHILPVLLFAFVHVLGPVPTLAGVATVTGVPAAVIHGWATAIRAL